MKEITAETKKIDLHETVSLLGVSTATVRNWIRHNYLTPQEDKALLFDYAQVKELQDNIATGKVDRLNKRANKRNSQNTFIPEEYADNLEVISIVEKIISDFNSQSYQLKPTLFTVILNLFKVKKLVDYSNCLNSFDIKNPVIKNELDWWKKNLDGEYDFEKYAGLLNMPLPPVSDILGLIYQSLAAEGDKAQAGSYYTPKAVVDEIISDYVSPQSVILDPCCGTGQFLLSASEVIENPANIWGFDIDELAVRIARANLLLKFNTTSFVPNVYRKNTLTELVEGSLFSEINTPKFDVVATNPPWGVHLSKMDTVQLQSLFPLITSNETFSYFIKRGINFLKDGGTLAYILPEAILNIKTHKDIRAIILRDTHIKRIKHLSRIFKNVFSPVIRLDVVKAKPQGLEELIAEKENSKHNVKQSRLAENQDFLFDVFNNNDDVGIFDKVYKHAHTTLKDNADWALGIVTGNNAKFLLKQIGIGAEPILTGKDIKRFITANPINFIKFEPDKFQQVAPDYKYRAKEKLVYKFISKYLVFSYDDKQTLTLNSANILIPKIQNYPIKTILALFNSSLYQFLYQKKFGAIKILRNDLEQLPLPIITEAKHLEIKNLIDKLLKRDAEEPERQLPYDELDKIIMDIFKLNELEQGHIRKSVKLSEKSLNITK